MFWSHINIGEAIWGHLAWYWQNDLLGAAESSMTKSFGISKNAVYNISSIWPISTTLSNPRLRMKDVISELTTIPSGKCNYFRVVYWYVRKVWRALNCGKHCLQENRILMNLRLPEFGFDLSRTEEAFSLTKWEIWHRSMAVLCDTPDNLVGLIPKEGGYQCFVNAWLRRMSYCYSRSTLSWWKRWFRKSF